MTTVKDYDRYVVRWFNLLDIKGCSEYYFFNGNPPLERTTKLVLLICYVDNENELNHDYSKAMSAVRCAFRNELEPTDIFDDPIIAAVRKSLKPSARELHIKRAKRFRLPTPYIFITYLRAVYWVDGEIENKMTYLGVAISYNYGLRSSEYTYDDKLKGEHAIRASDIFFVHKNGLRLFPWQITDLILNTDIISGKFSNVSGKTRTDGDARDLFLSRESEVESQLLHDILDWCRISKVTEDDIFLSRHKADSRGTIRRKQLIPRMVSCALKEAAIIFDLPPAMFSTHCNRIGCASDLAKYGLHDDDIKRFIGWTSDTSLLYQHGSAADPSALRAGAAGGTLSLSDVENLVPVCRSFELNNFNRNSKS